MGSARKRVLDSGDASHEAGAPIKKRRQVNEEHLKLAKLYEDLAAESDTLRLEAAKQLIIKFSPENKPVAKEVEAALSRLIKGLCSQRKAARVGFSLTLTELLQQIYSSKEHEIEGLNYDVVSVIKMVEEKTKVEGNVPGRERRDHLIGKLFGYKAIMESSIVFKPELSTECWNLLLDHIYGMARDVPWLREECGMILIEAVRRLKAENQYQICAEEVIQRLMSCKLVSTPEGVAIWLTVRASYEKALPDGVWHEKDPLSKKERTRLAKILKENFHDESEKGSGEVTKTAGANPNPSFAWDLVMSELLHRDEQSRSKGSEKLQFPQFWVDAVDNNLFSSTSSHERKAWGFKLLSSMMRQVPEWALSALLSPNLTRTLINQSKDQARFLHIAALSALKAVQSRVEQDTTSAVPIFVALSTKDASIESDRYTIVNTLEHILLSTDDESLRKIVRHLNSLILRPGSEEQSVADKRRQVVADLLLHTVKHYKRYSEMGEDITEKDSWLRKSLEILVENAYFVPNKSAKTSKVPLPPLSERSRNTFQERLSSCLTKLLDVSVGSRSVFAFLIIDMIRAKSTSVKTLDPVFKADQSISETMEKAFHTLDSFSTKKTSTKNKVAVDGFVLLYSLTLLQVYNGEGDAVMMLDDLDASRKAILKKKEDSTGQGHDVFVEVILSFLGNPRTLFQKIAEEAFSIFASEVRSGGLQSLTSILDTEESLEGQQELFNQTGDDDDAEENETSDDPEEDSDVEMIEGEADEVEDDSADDSDSDPTSEDENDEDNDDDRSEDDAELIQFNNLLALTLQTSKPNVNGDAPEESSDESDMDDDQMMALDPHISKIFQQRTKVTSTKQQRKYAKQTVVQFKSRVLDLLAIYLDKQYSNPLVLDILLPILRRTRAQANEQIADKATKILKSLFNTRTKHKAALPKPEDVDTVWQVLKGIHEEARMGNGANLHASLCSTASLYVVKVLVGVDTNNYSGVADVYAETQKQWFMDKKSPLQPVLFSQFLNWSQETRKQRK